jgi:hypothetical protein
MTPIEPWHRIATPRAEVREGRSFNPDEFAIALEQVVAGTAPADYLDPAEFLARTYVTAAMRTQLGIVLRRLAGDTEDAPPVLSFVTQFGGGKTHALTALWHLARLGAAADSLPGVRELLARERLPTVPHARVGVFVAMPGTRSPTAQRHGSISRRRSVAPRRSPSSVSPPAPILPAPPPSLRCSRPPRSPSLSSWMRS